MKFSGSTVAPANGCGCRRKRDVGIRIENLVRHPAFVEYLKSGYPSEGPVVEDLEGDRWLAFNIVRTGTAERQLLMVRDVSQEQQLQSSNT